MSEVVEVPRQEVLVVADTGEALVLRDATLQVIEVAEQGPPGPIGPPGSGGAQTLSLVAAHDLSGHRMVVATQAGAAYADPAEPAHADALVALTTAAALMGDTATVLAAGELDEPSWSWTPGQPLYVTANGLLAHAPPASGWVQMAALALTASRILLTPRQTIIQ